MTRKAVSSETQTQVLVQSRRRCCICFGLNRDTKLKGGQIAHLDQNRSNNSAENLAFLCFDHHDEYDSVTSQRKGFTIGEIKDYRRELLDWLGSAFSQKVHFGEVTTPLSDPFAGKYVSIRSGVDSSEILLTPLPDTYEGSAQYYVSGVALWGSQRPYGPNMGFMDFVGIMEDEGELRWTRKNGEETVVSVLTFDRHGGLNVVEHNWVGAYGMNVTFTGIYRRS